MPQRFRASRAPAPAADLRHPQDQEDQTCGSAASERSDAARTRVSIEDHRYTMPVVREIPRRQS